VWKQAFNSRLPTFSRDTYDIQGHSGLVVHTRLRYIYGMPSELYPTEISEKGRLDYLFDVFAIANEYQVPSLGNAVIEQVAQLMESYAIYQAATAHENSFFARLSVQSGRKKFGAVMSRTVDFYIKNDGADKSLMNGVLDTCFASVKNLKWLEQHVHISSLIAKYDPFAGRLLQLYLPDLQFPK
jgi:hypothetical protein